MLRMLFLALLALIVALPTMAQTYPVDRGSVLLGGSAAFQSEGFDGGDGRVTTLVLSPSFGYFVVPGLAVGGSVLVSRTSFDDEAITSLGIGPSAAYFFGTAESKAYPFVQAGVSYVTTSAGGDEDLTGLGADISVGSAFMLARNAALTAEAFTQFTSYSADGVDESISGNTYGVRAGISVFLF